MSVEETIVILQTIKITARLTGVEIEAVDNAIALLEDKNTESV